VQTLPIERFILGTKIQACDTIAIEAPLKIDLVFGHKHNRNLFPLTTVMRTPGHDIALVVGLLYSLGIVNKLKDILDILPCRRNLYEPTKLHRITISLDYDRKFSPDFSFENLPRFSSCGTCANYDLPRLSNNVALSKNELLLTAATLNRLQKTMILRQKIFQETGGVHAAASYSYDGEICDLFEDVGRHNALDKLIGNAFLTKKDLSANILLLSSRASFEIIQKASYANISIVAVMGAVSSLAISAAIQCGITLVGFLRDDRFNIYTNTTRVIP
jgi:FdhD protein